MIQGHLLKSRAKESWILYNRLTDEAGTGSAVADFPNGGLVVMIGNILHKGPAGRTPGDRLRHGGNQARAQRPVRGQQHDVLREPPPSSFFVRVEKTPRTSSPVIRNNLCIGAIPL